MREHALIALNLLARTTKDVIVTFEMEHPLCALSLPDWLLAVPSWQHQSRMPAQGALAGLP